MDTFIYSHNKLNKKKSILDKLNDFTSQASCIINDTN